MKVDNDVLTVLARATTEGDALTLVGQLDRKLYERTNKVLEAGGGKWNKKAKAHLFEGGAAEAMEQIIQTGEVTLVRTIQQDYGYFPTPEPVVARLIELAQLEPGMCVPSVAPLKRWKTAPSSRAARWCAQSSWLFRAEHDLHPASRRLHRGDACHARQQRG